MSYQDRIYNMLVEAKVTIKKGSKPGNDPKAAKKAQNVIADKENRRRTSVTGVKHRRKKPGEGKGFFDKKVIKY